MNWQDAFNLALALAAFLGGFFVKALWDAVKEARAAEKALADKVAAIELLVTGSYVTRAEYREDLKTIADALLRIEQKLDGKQDKDTGR